MNRKQPNIVMIVLDDLGFADFGCQGSPIATPNIDRLAVDGIRYSQFHVTPLCAPSRACFLTGRNHHRVGVGYLTDVEGAEPGYSARIPKTAATLPRLLRDSGYNTFAAGKWHLAPRSELGPAGPFDRWPLGMGFERFYGFMHGMIDNYRPDLVRDNGFSAPPLSENYHLSEDLATEAIQFVQSQQHARPDKPFFLYFAPAAVHCPHQAPEAAIAPYKGRFVHGWDIERGQRFARQKEVGVVPPTTRLTERPAWISEWDQLSADEQLLFQRQMEVYAGYLTHTDAQIGRIIDFLGAIGRLKDSIVVVTSDNGADGMIEDGDLPLFDDAEDVRSRLRRIDQFGGREIFHSYPSGWAWAGNTPFRLWKSYTWLGGVRVPMIVHWPAGIDDDSRGAVRSQFAHAVDLMPTLLEAAGVGFPSEVDGYEQQSLDGSSFLSTLNDSDAPAARETQYFEMMGSRSIYHRGWKATTDHVYAEDPIVEGSQEFSTDHWSLFKLDSDFSEADDISLEEPERLKQMIELWWHEAGRNQVLPLMDHWIEFRPQRKSAPLYPHLNPPRVRYDCLPGEEPIETFNPFSSGFSFTAELGPGGRDASEIVCAHYLQVSGLWSPRPAWECRLVDGRLFVVFGVGPSPTVLSVDRVPLEQFELSIDFTPNSAGARAVIRINGKVVAERQGIGDIKSQAKGGDAPGAKLMVGCGRFDTDEADPSSTVQRRIRRAILERVDATNLGTTEQKG